MANPNPATMANPNPVQPALVPYTPLHKNPNRTILVVLSGHEKNQVRLRQPVVAPPFVPNSEHPCYRCGVDYDTLELLAGHYYYEHPTDEHGCSSCNNWFKKKEDLEEHQRTLGHRG